MLFRIVPVVLKGPRVNIETYAFLDEGSSISMIDDALIARLQVQGNPKPLMLKWTGGNHRVVEKSCAFTLKVASKENEATIFDLKVRSVPNLELPSQTVDVGSLTQSFNHLRHLPIHSYYNKKPEILIGIDHWHLTVPLKIKEGGEGEPIATKTRLGWCVGGNYSQSSAGDIVASHFHVCECQNANDKDLDKLVRNYFTVESMGVTQNKDSSFTTEEKKALQIMEKTTILRQNRYEVGLLWRFDEIRMPDSFSMAFSRLRCLESQFKSSPALLEEVSTQLKQHLVKGYIRELSSEELDAEYPRVWYLPFFPVKNLNKPGKVRLVWDAAAKVNGLSLNDALLKGPDLTANLLGVIFRFRERRVALTADIQEMFHRVLIRPVDQHAQRFLWRDADSNKKPRTYVMTSMTFGATCSPFQAQYVKNMNATRFEKEFPRAVRAIKQNHYVDDLLDCVDSEDEAVSLAREIKAIHAAGGFNIRNFRSNSRKVEQTMNEAPLDVPYQFTSPDNEIQKVLGIFWDTKADVITYSLRYNKSNIDILSGQHVPTKRETLRTLMSIYDPPGYLAHFLINLKILQQDLWRGKLGWDDHIPDDALKKWLQWIKHLPLLDNIRIPRFYLSASEKWEECKTDLHIFVDASTAACAAVAYIRIESLRNIKVSLVGAKTKVAPLKLLSVPRLELIAAVLGVRLAKSVKELHCIKFSKTFYWSDSKVVLAWIHSNKKLTQFVSFRVSEIHESSDASDWRYVPTNENVADLATKWQDKINLSMESKWFLGPSFLQGGEEKWPSSSSLNVPLREILEENTIAHHEKANPIIEFHRFSNWERLLKATAYVRRFIAVRRGNKIKGSLSADELGQSEKTLFIEAQKQFYAADIILLKKNKTLSKHSPLRKLSPFIDECGILRIQGRIEASEHCQYDTKFPIILPPLHRITELIVIQEHRKCLHHFNETVVANLRQRFYIPRLRRLVRKIKQNCPLCCIIMARPQVPQMAPLPAARLASYCPPFTFTRVDLFGPLSVIVRRRPEKRWGVIFTCLSVRCIHLELTSTLSTDGFLLCLRNFTNRRGQPREIYCDRGTNFIGAERILRQQIQEVDFDRIAEETTRPTMQWKFNPPSAPHMGGAWERLIRSIKASLYIMIPPNRNPSPEVLQSALIEVEYIINSRPLTYVPVDSVEVEPLTPNKFLLGSARVVNALGHLTDDAMALKLQWKASQQMAQRFWKKWINEYLPTLTRRSKWFEPSKELKVGDLVIIVDEDCKQRRWPNGRVLEVIPSKDGHIRKAIVQTTEGVLERPAAKLAIIDVASPLVDSGQRGGV